MRVIPSSFEELTSPERLFEAWYDFRKGKTKRRDVQAFARHLEKQIFRLHRDLRSGRYRHAPYESFYVHDPKRRHIRKACVRDRLVHQTLYTTLQKLYEPRFIPSVYSNRIGKGVHRANDDFRRRLWKVSHNLTRPCWVLKCDIRRFYDSVDHETLLSVLSRTVRDKNVLSLLRHVVDSFHVEGVRGKGIPIGNLTSQIFTNIYLNEFDQYVKHNLRTKHYLRFADDCLFLSHRRDYLERMIPCIQEFLVERLKLSLHPKKIILRPLKQGVDYLGIVTLPYHRTLRTKTKRRMMRRLRERQREFFAEDVDKQALDQSLQSYLGMLSHVDGYHLSCELLNVFSF